MKNKNIDFAFKKIKDQFEKIKKIIASFSITEKVVLTILSFVLIFSILGILVNVNSNYTINVPDKGGVLTEGVIGTPLFVNPVIANSNTDKDLVSLIYSGLLKIGPNNEIINDLAEKFEVSEDNLIYDFYLKEDLTFHDKTEITADDIVFTILKIQDPQLRSPRISNWENIAIEKVSNKQVRFILEQPRADFLNNLDFGILPKHIWQEFTNETFSLNIYNTEPVGSGPYKISKIRKNKIEIPESYTLTSFKKHALGQPLIDKIILKFVKNENELIELINDKKIDSVGGITSKSLVEIKIDKKLITTSLPRVFGLFINQVESPVLSLNSAREALRLATPKEKIIDQVFEGFAEIANSPIPNLNLENNFEQNLEQAEQILIDAGWEKNDQGVYTIETEDQNYILSTSISTSNVPELIKVAELVAEDWKKIGAQVEVKIFEISDLNQNVIRPRNFEILLFGNEIDNYSDLYAFWHSSRRNDPGLNITSYANIETDKILDEFLIKSKEKVEEKQINKFLEEIKKDVPAIFLYTPKFIYLTDNKIKNIEISEISEISDRFQNINNWFINQDKIWKFFN